MTRGRQRTAESRAPLNMSKLTKHSDQLVFLSQRIRSSHPQGRVRASAISIFFFNYLKFIFSTTSEIISSEYTKASLTFVLTIPNHLYKHLELCKYEYVTTNATIVHNCDALIKMRKKEHTNRPLELCILAISES